MDRYVMRRVETGGIALIPASSVDLHRGLGWSRVSDAIAEEAMHGINVADYANAPDLDLDTPIDIDVNSIGDPPTAFSGASRESE